MEGRYGFFPHAAAASCGFVVIMAVTLATGRSDAVDQGAYWTIGQPLMCAVAFAIGYQFPRRPWRWAVGMTLGQFLAGMANGNSLNLLPFVIAFWIILTLPQLLAAHAGSWFSRRGRK